MTYITDDARAAADLAGSHGLEVDPASIWFNEIGLDFRVGFATAGDGSSWVLRIPRRADVLERARIEARALHLVRPHLPVEVPDWRIFDDDLIAYPMLHGQPALTFDPETYEVTWHFDRTSPAYVRTLGKALSALHAIDAQAAGRAAVPVFTPGGLRTKWLADLDRVRTRFEIDPALWERWQVWIADDSYWPDVTVPIHGDLYAGHVLVEPDGSATGIIDWTEACVGDPAVDLTGHVRAFGADALPALIEAYAEAGGHVWPRLEEHCLQLAGANAVSYALYALETGDPQHMAAAQQQLTPTQAST